MTTGTCSCGATVRREIPAGLQGLYRELCERTPLVCSACVERIEREEWERERAAQAWEREQQLKARRRASGIPATLCELTWAQVAENRPDVLGTAQAWAA